MSIKWMTAAWESPYEGAQLLILLAIADYAREDGVAWPSVGSLARKARCTDAWVFETFKQFEADGWLMRQPVRGKPSFLHLSIPSSAHINSVDPSTPVDPIHQEEELTTTTEPPKELPPPPSERDARASLADWQPSANDLAWAAARCVTVDVLVATGQWREFHLAHGTVPKSPSALWRAWMAQQAVGPTPAPLHGSASRTASAMGITAAGQAALFKSFMVKPC